MHQCPQYMMTVYKNYYKTCILCFSLSFTNIFILIDLQLRKLKVGGATLIEKQAQFNCQSYWHKTGKALCPLWVGLLLSQLDHEPTSFLWLTSVTHVGNFLLTHWNYLQRSSDLIFALQSLLSLDRYAANYSITLLCLLFCFRYESLSGWKLKPFHQLFFLFFFPIACEWASSTICDAWISSMYSHPCQCGTTIQALTAANCSPLHPSKRAGRIYSFMFS